MKKTIVTKTKTVEIVRNKNQINIKKIWHDTDETCPAIYFYKIIKVYEIHKLDDCGNWQSLGKYPTEDDALQFLKS